MEKSQPFRLTQTVIKGGCAAKVAAVELRKILAELKWPTPPADLLVGSATFDDAAVTRINDSLALVQTLDFFTPIVDSPRLFGQIAAANALSDVYAMGGRPNTAMAILAYPVASFAPAIVVEVLQGALEKITESGAHLVGGHTIDDDTLKFGLSVSGYVHPQRIWSNAGAKSGDILILTKALGTGTSTAALKRGEVDETGIAAALASMSQLNKAIDVLPEELIPAIHAATDVTGFGLAGHGFNMAKASAVTLEIETWELPALPRAIEFLEKKFLTKAHRTNREYVESKTEFGDISEALQLLTFDPQTSGGLLLSVDGSKAGEILAALQSQFPRAKMIGHVIAPQGECQLRFL